MTEWLGLAKYPVGSLQGDRRTRISEAICGLHLEMWRTEWGSVNIAMFCGTFLCFKIKLIQGLKETVLSCLSYCYYTQSWQNLSVTCIWNSIDVSEFVWIKPRPPHLDVHKSSFSGGLCLFSFWPLVWMKKAQSCKTRLTSTCFQKSNSWVHT